MGCLSRMLLEKIFVVLVRVVVSVTGTNMVVQVFLSIILGQLAIWNVHHAAAEVRVVRLRGDDQAPHVNQCVFAAFLQHNDVEGLLKCSRLLQINHCAQL